MTDEEVEAGMKSLDVLAGNKPEEESSHSWIDVLKIVNTTIEDVIDVILARERMESFNPVAKKRFFFLLAREISGMLIAFISAYRFKNVEDKNEGSESFFIISFIILMRRTVHDYMKYFEEREREEAEGMQKIFAELKEAFDKTLDENKDV